ncbi:MAG: PH domain-containing protein [Alphaproteobacteria bacterium]|nr:MAG: PH domain-containing protein [Alphaproteobacteria bacterium]
MADAKAVPKTPLLRLHSHFSPLLVFYHHPIRVAVSLLIAVMLLPELHKFIRDEWHLAAADAQMAAVLGIFGVVFLPQLLVSALDCSRVAYAFYDDHVEFTESFLVRDVIRMPYSSIRGVSMSAGLMQRLVGVANIALVMHGRTNAKRNPQQLSQVIRDVRKAPAAVREIEKILQKWQAAAPPPPSVRDSAGSRPPP